MAVRDRREVRRHVESQTTRATRAVHRAIERRRQRVQALIDQYGFRRQRDALRFIEQRIDEWRERMLKALEGIVRHARARFEHATRRYGLREWPASLAGRRAEIGRQADQMTDALVRAMHDRRRRLAGFADRLRALSPRLVLERGFCIARTSDGTLIRDAGAIEVGQLVAIEFARGEADARVEQLRRGGNHAT
jgi:exodeoxyribonuclease VII large subunit